MYVYLTRLQVKKMKVRDACKTFLEILFKTQKFGRSKPKNSQFLLVIMC